MTTSALLFDFDGLVLDTEWPVYAAVRAEFVRVGSDFPLDEWQQVVGTAHSADWLERLQETVDGPLDHRAVETRRRAHRDALLEAEAPRPGVIGLLDAADERGVPAAIASSSPTVWVDDHLTRIGLHRRFAAVRTRDDVPRAKPAPDLFLAAAAAVGAVPGECVALEDSIHGCAAARAAGTRVVAVPNRITAGGDFSAADLVVDSLADPAVLELIGW